MTNHFRDKLGERGYGSVYKGNLKDDQLVAVNLLKKSKRNGEEFINVVASSQVSLRARPPPVVEQTRSQLVAVAGAICIDRRRQQAAVASSGRTTEALSVNLAFHAIRRSDVVALVIEAMACITEQDSRIADRIEKERRRIIVVCFFLGCTERKRKQSKQHKERRGVEEEEKNLVSIKKKGG
ncbi:hypothetical protein Dimus_034056 [Dionaea muscipula]